MKHSKVTLVRAGAVVIKIKIHLVATGLIILTPFAIATNQLEQQPQASNLAYVGSNGRIGVGYDTKTKLRGDVYWTFSEEELAAWIGEGWGSGSAGGLKLNYQWIPGGQEKAVSQSVRKLFAAVDQNDQHDQKFTLGGGLEHENLFFGTYVSAALSGRRTISDSTSNVSDTAFGTEQDGRQYSRDVFTATRLRLYERPYDYGVGARAGRYFNEPLIRLSGGLDYEWGRDSNHQATLSVMLEKFIPNTPHSFSVNAEVYQKSGALEQNRNDQRLYFMYRYEFGDKSYRPEREYRMVEASSTSTAQPAETAISTAEAVASVAETSASAAGASVGVAESKPKTEKRMVKTTAAMLSDAFFEFDSDKLTPEAKAALDSVIVTVNKAGYSGNIHLTGHTCNIGKARQNLNLSERRALAVKKFLVETGKIASETIIAEGKGEDNPRYPNVKGSRHKNRRVDLEFVTYTEKLEDVELPAESAQVETSTTPSTSTSTSTSTTKPMKVEWVREYIDTEPAWLRRALHNTVSHKQSVDVYRQQDREVKVTSSDKRYINRAPSAQNEVFSINSGETALFDVLANDSDPDQDLLNITSVTLPANGIASVSGNKISYTPAPGFTGSDNFSYTIADDKGATSTAQVAVTVKAINRAPRARNDAFSMNSGETALLDVLANDGDPDQDPLKITSVTLPSHGSASVSGNNISYTPAPGFIGSDNFSYTIADDKGEASSAQATITVKAANRAPVAADDRFVVQVSSSSSLNVLANDSDPDGDALTIVSFTQPGVGSISQGDNGNLAYSPSGRFTITIFSYTLSDGKGGTSTANVTLIDP